MDNYHIRHDKNGDGILCRTIMSSSPSHDRYYSNLTYVERGNKIELIDEFKFIKNDRMYTIEEGYSINISKYVNFLVKSLLKDRIIRTIIIFSYHKDVLIDCESNLLSNLYKLLKDDGFNPISRYLLSFGFNIW